MFKVELTAEEILLLMALAKLDADNLAKRTGSENSDYPDLEAWTVAQLEKSKAIHQKLSTYYAEQWTAANADKQE